MNINEQTIVTIYVKPRPESKMAFLNWQAKLNAAAASFPGFVSLEMVLSHDASNEWMIVQRFNNHENFVSWRLSTQNIELIQELKSLTSDPIREIETNSSNFQGGVTEVLITQINPEKEKTYREWIAKIHEVEAKFPGFRGTYVQSPNSQQGNWITLLHFDTLEHLDQWLSSNERQQILKESSSLITSLENHRVMSPYAGWFASITKEGKTPPPVWKQTMLILLVLFPIVMLEMKFLNPLTAGLNVSLATFIGNAISVSLVSWPMMPIAIRSLKWWLFPQSQRRFLLEILGVLLVIILYIIEIAILWKLI